MKLLLALLFTFQGFAADDAIPKSQWTFKSEPVRAPYALGLKKDPSFRSAFTIAKDTTFLKAEIKIKPEIVLGPLTPVLDQGQCGSCVYFATTAGVQDMHYIRGYTLPQLSEQYVMDCGGRQWMCDGSFFEKVAMDYVNLGGTLPESKYPYRAVNSSCKGKVADVLGKVASYKLIDTSDKSIITALAMGYVVPVTVGADSTWMSYRGGGTYNACTSQSTNHQILLVGARCNSSVDSEGNCAFDSAGKLVNGDGEYRIKNSWSTSWGDAGYMWTKIRGKNGKKCNNLAEEAGILEIAAQPTPTPTPSPTITPTPIPPGPTPGPTPPVPPQPGSKFPFWMYGVIAIGAIVLIFIGSKLLKKGDPK